MKIMDRILYTSFLLFTCLAYSQSDPNNLVLNGNSNILNKNYKDAEIDYRKAISKNKNQNKASHNLGNLLLKTGIMMRLSKSILKLKKTQK